MLEEFKKNFMLFYYYVYSIHSYYYHWGMNLPFKFDGWLIFIFLIYFNIAYAMGSLVCFYNLDGWIIFNFMIHFNIA